MAGPDPPPFWHPTRKADRSAFPFQALARRTVMNINPAHGPSTDGMRIATVCRRGHPNKATLTAIPNGDLGFCNECGAAIISRCPHCDTRIRGMEGGIITAMTRYLPPKFRGEY